MQLIRCTRKLQKAVGITSKSISRGEPSPSLLGGWFANLVDFAGDSCIILVNEKTFINFIIDFRSADSVSAFKSSFRLGVSCHLSELGTPEELKGTMLEDYQDIEFANTDSRQIVGTMNQLTLEYSFLVEEAGGIHSAQIPRIIQQMNKTIIRQLDWNYPVEAFRILCQSK